MNKKSMKLNAVLNGIKTFVTIIFPVITFPYITRVLGVDNIGKINFATSIVSYFSLIAALGITNYAIREGSYIIEDREQIEKFTSQIFSINLLTTLVAYILLGATIVFFPALQDYKIIIGIQSLSVLFTTLGVEWLYSIYEDYLYITVRTIVVQVVSLVLLVILVHNPEDYMKYMWISVMPVGVANVINLYYSKKHCRIKITSKLNLRQHIMPMFILGCNTIAITIYVNSDVTILEFLMGDYSVGIYSVAVKIYTVIKQIINALIVVSLPRLSVLYLSGNYIAYNQLLKKILKALLLILFPVIFGISMLSEEAVIIVGGRDYTGSAASLQILSLAVGFSLMASFFTTTVLLPHKKEKYILRATVISALVNIALNFVLIPIWGERGAAFTTVLAEFLVMMIALYYSRGDYEVTGIQSTALHSLAGCMGIVFVCGMIRRYIPSLILRVVLSVTISMVVYVAIILILKDESAYEVLGSFKNMVNRKNKGR